MSEKVERNQDIAKLVSLFVRRKLKIGAKVERKSRYCKDFWTFSVASKIGEKMEQQGS